MAYVVKMASRDRILEAHLQGDETGDEVVDRLLAIPNQRVLAKSGAMFDRAAIDGFAYDTSRLMSTASTIARTLVEHEHMTREEAVDGLNTLNDHLTILDSGFAAFRGSNEATLVYEDIRLKTLSGDFDAMRAAPPEPKDLTEVEKSALQNGDSTKKDSVSEDEGVFQTALHSAEDVLDIDLDRMVYTKLNWFGTIYGLAWPDHSLWNSVVNGLAEKALNTIEYAKADMTKWIADSAVLQTRYDSTVRTYGEKSKAARKEAEALAAHRAEEPRDPQKVAVSLKRRMYDISRPFNEPARPELMHWRVNSVMRSIYRQLMSSRAMIERYLGQIDRITLAAHGEALSGKPSVLTRLQTEQGEQREQTLLFSLVVEGDTGEESDQYGLDRVPFVPDEAWVVTVNWYNQVIGAIEGEIAALTEVYDDLTQLEYAVLPMWAENGDDMPTKPPLYWNLAGPVYTDVEAEAAFKVEQAEQSAKFMEENKALSGDALRKAFALLPDLSRL